MTSFTPIRRIVAPLAVLNDGEGPAVIEIGDDGHISLLLTGDDATAAASSLTASSSGASTLVLNREQVLIPGLVDTHVHVNEPGRTEWEGFTSATNAAAAGGVTTILDMPLNSIPVTTTGDALRIKREAAAPQVRVDVGFWGGAVPENLAVRESNGTSIDDLSDLWEAGVYGFKSFTSPSGIPEFGHLDKTQLLAAASRIAALGGLLIVHAEDPAHLHAAMHLGKHYPDFLASRPDEAETTAVGDVIEASRRTGCRVHILHVSSAATLPLLRAAQMEGLPVTAETCPHYVAVDAESIPDGATQFKCCPPIRDEHNRDALWAGLADGTITCVVSDHSPATADLKFAGDGDWALAWGGISSLQLSFAVTWTEARRRGVAFDDVVRWMSSAPADLVGLDRGRIREGGRADLAVIRPEATFRVDAPALYHRNPVSAYQGDELAGVVDLTLLAGQPVYRDGALIGEPVGRLLRR